MSGRAKLLVFFVVMVGIVGAAMVGGYLWSKEKLAELAQKAELATEEGLAYAKEHDQLACRDEGIRRTEGCGMSAVCEAESQRFTAACLTAAKPVTQLCVGIPERLKNDEASIRWAEGVCKAYGTEKTERCVRLLATLQDYCAKPEHKTQPEDAAKTEDPAKPEDAARPEDAAKPADPS